MDVVWKVLSQSNTDLLPAINLAAGPSQSAQGQGHGGFFSYSGGDLSSPLAGDKILTTSGTFSGSYGTSSEVDDVFSSSSMNSSVPQRHTPEEMRQLHLGHLYLVFDFVDTDLSKIIRSNQYMTKGHVQFILYQLLLGLKYMHSANVIHR